MIVTEFDFLNIDIEGLPSGSFKSAGTYFRTQFSTVLQNLEIYRDMDHLWLFRSVKIIYLLAEVVVVQERKEQ